MRKLFLLGACSAALLMPLAGLAQDHDRDHDDHRYYDRRHKDYHNWNDHEDRAWHMYWEQRHRPYIDWNRAPERERQRYWAWRHEHSDALLHIDIR
jgi:hypothetical protein